MAPVQLLHCSHWLVLTTNQLEGQSIPMTCKQQAKLNYNRQSHTKQLKVEEQKEEQKELEKSEKEDEEEDDRKSEDDKEVCIY